MALFALLWIVSLSQIEFGAAETFHRHEQITSSIDCRSNSTHIAWSVSAHDQNLQYVSGHSLHVSLVRERRRQAAADSCRWQTREEASQELYSYLRHHVMEFDLPFLETLGFDEEGASEDLPDGLGDGMVGKTIELALQTKIDFPHADEIPYEIWCEFVLNYANTNEARR